MNVEDVLYWVRRHLWWLLPVVLIVVNLLLVSTYRSLYAGRVAALNELIDEERADLQELREQGEELERVVDRVARADAGIELMYEDTLGPESARFTSIVREVRALAENANLAWERISFPEQVYEDYGLIKRSFMFAVEGRYADLRRFINFLELSESFLVLESLGLQDAESGLRIRVVMSTLFAGRDEGVDLASLAEQGVDDG